MLANVLSSEISSNSLWADCLAYIKEKVGSASYETWFRTTDITFGEDGKVCVQVPNQFFADWIEEHYAALVVEALAASGVEAKTLAFESTKRDWEVIEPVVEEIEKAQERKIPVAVDNKKMENFHPNYRFETFVVGDGNRMAHAAATAVAEAPGKNRFNPLVIYGGTGLGKTHLLQAIGHFAQTEGTADNVVYMTSEEFTNRFIEFVHIKKEASSFYEIFNDVDLLLIDDIQFFSKKVETQKEFYRIFNRLLMDSKQIVLSSDRQPDMIPDMMEHIINRFKGGLNTDIQPPNLETRMAILRKKAEFDGLALPDEVVQYIANHITSSIRELEGTLTKLIAFSSFIDTDISLEAVRELCGDAISNREERLTVKLIKEVTAQTYGIGVNQLSAHTRKKDVSLPRSVAMYLCKKWTKQSLRTIGLEFGGRDYSTVIHAAKKIDANLADETQTDLRAKIAAIEDILIDTQ